MTLVDSTLRYAIPSTGVGVRWLKQDLRARGVSVPLTDPFLRELVADALDDVSFVAPHLQPSGSFVSRSRQQISRRADFVRAWTLSDETAGLDEKFGAHLPAVARRHAVPRPWRLSEPVAAASLHPTPTYLYWASAS